MNNKLLHTHRDCKLCAPEARKIDTIFVAMAGKGSIQEEQGVDLRGGYPNDGQSSIECWKVGTVKTDGWKETLSIPKFELIRHASYMYR